MLVKSFMQNISILNKLQGFLPFIATFVNTMASPGTIDHNFYSVRPVKLGVEVRGIDLKTDIPQSIVDQIRNDVHKYRIMIFKEQGSISGKRHVEISQWFGEIESTFYKHHKSPHPDVFRVSNDKEEGCTGVGRTGWHIDGSFQPAPFTHSLYHIVSASRKGNTVFAPLNELIHGLTESQLARWERLWMVSDARADRSHPLIYSHPVTGKRTLCFHLGMTEAFIWDYGSKDERITEWPETVSILREIHHELVKDDGAIQYSHEYEPGDFIISDNLALGHMASPETQLPREQVGLRVMHRTTVKGTVAPTKNYNPHAGTGRGTEDAKHEL